ncbi:MAG: GcrA family cell cycle regulator [Devosia sp.]
MMSPDLITNSVWDDPRNIETLTTMWTEGAPVIDIADACGTTRGSVIGKARRLKLPEHANSHNLRAVRPDHHRNRGQTNGAAIAARVDARQRSIALAERQHARNEHRREGSVPETDAGMGVTHLVGIMDLTAHTCRWPAGDPLLPGFGFCGREPVPDKPYCAEHDRRAHVRLGVA